MFPKQIVQQHQDKMKKAIEVLQDSFKLLRTGRASAGLVENLRVEYYGTPTPLKQLATFGTPQADMIVIKPFDPACIKDIEKAIKASDLSMAPIVEGKIIRLNVPPLSEERRKQIVHQIKQAGEQAKVGVRNIRRDANKELEKEEKDKTITEDDRKDGEKQMDDITKDYTGKIDSIIKIKSDEVMSS